METAENTAYLTLIKTLAASGVLKDKHIVNAFLAIDRQHFITPENIARSYENVELPTKAGQNTSNPKTVALMLELLMPKPGDKVLDLGSGAGWTTALLAYLVAPNGYVWGVEIVPELVEIGQRNLFKYNFGNVKIVNATKELGLAANTPFNKILVTSYAKEIPTELTSQLAIGGTLVMPINNTIVKVDKMSDTEYTTKEYPGHVFLPLLKVERVKEKIL